VLPISAASTVGMLRLPLAQSLFLMASIVIPGKAEKDFDKGHREGVFCVAFSPDGKLFASGSGDRTIKIWNVDEGTVVHDLVNPHLKPSAAAAPASSAPPQAHPGWVYGLRFTPTGKQLVSVGMAPRNHGYSAVWNVADGKLLYSEELPLGAIYSVAISPDGKLLALACGPRGRQFQEANCYLMKMPELDSGQASDAGK